MQDGHEHFVQGHAQHGRLIRRFAGIGAVIDRVVALGNAVDGKDRKVILLVVITGVVAIRALQRMLKAAGVVGIRIDMTFQHDLGRGGYLQIAAYAFDQLGLATAQQTGKLILAKAIRHWRNRAKDGGRITTQYHRHRIRLARIASGVLAKIQRPAAMRQPPHNDLVAADKLLAINAQVLPLFSPARA